MEDALVVLQTMLGEVRVESEAQQTLAAALERRARALASLDAALREPGCAPGRGTALAIARVASTVAKVAAQRSAEAAGLVTATGPMRSLVQAEERLLPEREAEVAEADADAEPELCQVLIRMRQVHCLALAQVAANSVVCQWPPPGLAEQVARNADKLAQLHTRHTAAASTAPAAATESLSPPRAFAAIASSALNNSDVAVRPLRSPPPPPKKMTGSSGLIERGSRSSPRGSPRGVVGSHRARESSEGVATDSSSPSPVTLPVAVIGSRRAAPSAMADVSPPSPRGNATTPTSPRTTGLAVSPRTTGPASPRTTGAAPAQAVRTAVSPRGGRPPPPSKGPASPVVNYATLLPPRPMDTSTTRKLREMARANPLSCPVKALFLELLEDERTFVEEQLLTVGEHFINPIKEGCGGSLSFRPEEQELGRMLFQVYEPLIAFHVELLGRMFKAFDDWDEPTVATNVWLHHLELCERLYSSAPEQARLAQGSLRVLLGSKPSPSSAPSSASSSRLSGSGSLNVSLGAVSMVHAVQAGCKHFDLAAALQRPFDRPWKQWHAFLESTLLRTEFGDPALPELEFVASALERMRHVVEETSRRHEDQRKMESIVSQISGAPVPLVDGERYLLRFGKVDGRGRGKESDAVRFCIFLFSDIFVVCQRSEDVDAEAYSIDAGKYLFLAMWRLADEDAREEPSDSPAAFGVREFVFRARDEESCEKWVSTYKQARTRLKRTAQFGVPLGQLVKREVDNEVPSVVWVLVEGLRELARSDRLPNEVALFQHNARNCTASAVENAKLMLDRGVLPALTPELMSMLLVELLRALPDPLVPADAPLWSALERNDPPAGVAEQLAALEAPSRFVLLRLCALVEELSVAGACSLSAAAIVLGAALSRSPHVFHEFAQLVVLYRGLQLPQGSCASDSFHKETVVDYTRKKMVRVKELEAHHATRPLQRQGVVRLRKRKTPGWHDARAELRDQLLTVFEAGSPDRVLCRVLLGKATCTATQDATHAFKVVPRLVMGSFVFAVATGSELQAWIAAVQQAAVVR